MISGVCLSALRPINLSGPWHDKGITQRSSTLALAFRDLGSWSWYGFSIGSSAHWQQHLGVSKLCLSPLSASGSTLVLALQLGHDVSADIELYLGVSA